MPSFASPRFDNLADFRKVRQNLEDEKGDFCPPSIWERFSEPLPFGSKNGIAVLLFIEVETSLVSRGAL